MYIKYILKTITKPKHTTLSSKDTYLRCPYEQQMCLIEKLANLYILEATGQVTGCFLWLYCYRHCTAKLEA